VYLFSLGCEIDDADHVAAMREFISGFLTDTNYVPDVTLEQLPMNFDDALQPPSPTNG